LVVTNVSG